MYNTEYFKKRAKLVHRTRYGYDKSIYVASEKKLVITCKIHGDFQQTPHSHLRGGGCNKCARLIVSGKVKMPDKLYFKRANIKHGNKYDYTNTRYIGIDKNIEYVCPKHGLVKQRADGHLKYGCDRCGIDTRKVTFDNFVKRAEKIHGKEYEYDKKYYEALKDKIGIKCRKHGMFYQTGDDHLKGSGCSKCKQSIGERLIADYLKANNVDFIIEFKIPNNGYRYDFYLPKYNMLIEYDGIQHFKPIGYFGGDVGFKKIVKVDNSKTELAKKFKYKLLRISYKEKKNINVILNNIIRVDATTV